MNDEKKREEVHRLRVELEAAAHRTEEARLAAASAIAKLELVELRLDRLRRARLREEECPICSIDIDKLFRNTN